MRKEKERDIRLFEIYFSAIPIGVSYALFMVSSLEDIMPILVGIVCAIGGLSLLIDGLFSLGKLQSDSK